MPLLTRRDRAHLLVIDVQERLAPAIEGHSDVVANCGRLIAYARRLGVPITFTEQYPKGIGRTLTALTEIAGGGARVLEKVEFSCWRNAGIRAHVEALARDGRREIVVCGMEAHVCVLQTVVDLVTADLDVFVAADAVGSRRGLSRDVGLARMTGAGAVAVTQEMVAFEWLERAGTAEFKDLMAIVK